MSSIPFAAERLAQEEAKQERSEMSRTLRAGALAQLNEKNGNVLRPNEPVPGPPPRHLPPEPLFKQLRKFPEREEQVVRENHARQKVGASRFHIVPTSSEEAHRERTIVSRLEAQKGTTSVIGFGRADLPTYGAVDNFKPAPYTAADLISKPKLRPPPPGSVAAQRNVGQVSLTDGSGGAGWGRRGDPLGQNVGSPRSQAQQQAPQRMQTAGAVPPIGPVASRRNNFNNASSAGLLDAFNYPNVTNVWTRNGAGTTSSTTWGRGGTANAANAATSAAAASSSASSAAPTAPPTAGGAPPATASS